MIKKFFIGIIAVAMSIIGIDASGRQRIPVLSTQSQLIMQGMDYQDRGAIYRAIDDLEAQLFDLRQQRTIIKEQERLIEFRLEKMQRKLETITIPLSTRFSPPPPKSPPTIPLPPVPHIPQQYKKPDIYKLPKGTSSEVALDVGKSSWLEKMGKKKIG